MSDTKNYHNWNGDLDNANNKEHDCKADIESHVEQYNGIENLNSPEQQDVSAV